MIQWEVYKNLQKFIVEYRKWEVVGSFLDEGKFTEKILHDDLVKIFCIDKNNKNVELVLLNKDNEAASKTDNFRTLMKKVKSDIVIIISYNNISTQIKSKFKEFDTEIINYSYNLFKIEIPKGPYCFPHRILSEEEVSQLLEFCKKERNGFPKCKHSDPQIIWIGGKPGDLIEITSDNPNTGTELRYRIVTKD